MFEQVLDERKWPIHRYSSTCVHRCDLTNEGLGIDWLRGTVRLGMKTKRHTIVYVVDQ